MSYLPRSMSHMNRGMSYCMSLLPRGMSHLRRCTSSIHLK
jgi:hypothetical protein